VGAGGGEFGEGAVGGVSVIGAELGEAELEVGFEFLLRRLGEADVAIQGGGGFRGLLLLEQRLAEEEQRGLEFLLLGGLVVLGERLEQRRGGGVVAGEVFALGAAQLEAEAAVVLFGRLGELLEGGGGVVVFGEEEEVLGVELGGGLGEGVVLVVLARRDALEEGAAL